MIAVITANFPTKSGKPELDLRIAKGIEIMSRLQKNRHDIFGRPGAFDGKKNLFSFTKYSFPTLQEVVSLDDQATGNRRQKMVTVTISYVNEVDVDRLNQVIQAGKARISDLGAQGVYSISLNMLNLFVQSQPKQSHLFKGKSFFIDRNRAHQSDRGLSPLKLLDGLFQSVRPAMDRIVLNVDVTVGAVLPDWSLEDICTAFLRLRDSAALHRLEAASQELRKLNQFLKGTKIVIRTPGGGRQRERVIKEIVADVGKKKFDKNGQQITVYEHFLRTYNLQMRSPSLGVRVGNHELFPVHRDICQVINQVYKGRLQPDQIREVLGFVPRNPQDRLQKIQAGWSAMGHQTSEFLLAAGITISNQPIRVTGRLLDSPQIVYGPRAPSNRPTCDVVQPRYRGVWDVMNKRLKTPAQVRGMLIVNFVETNPSHIMHRFVTDLIEVMRERGMKVPSEGTRISDIETLNGQNPDIEDKLKELGARHHSPSLILAILPQNALDLYNAIKRFGDVTVGVATQCVRWTEKIYRGYNAGKCNQYHNNLILKINGKLGGINHIPASKIVKSLSEREGKKGTFMIIGADVSHPGPGSKQPSIASVVGSYDEHGSCYVPVMHVQPSRMEVIENISAMLAKLLSFFYVEIKNPPPRRIVIFRDGVSEGEFETVRQYELGRIKETLERMYQKINQPMPLVTYIIVGKRHHYRFFPEDPTRPNQADPKSGNCHSGFVVDRDIVHPVYRDFYLLSQAGLKGTSIPSHYTILEDENFGGDANKLQELTYALCHSYQRATRTVKIPAPVYYADLVCRRAKFHFDSAEVVYSDNMQHFKQANPAALKGMYFL
ncbi:hypothetical protein D9758_005903 [Tetrapyrgos nigripes]|uniref:Piwi domain-containing protein n=1 Tax=Tetrapyrgos nigripes TaxID=182062 RepID=A0A8H5LHK1_9AGAR|nr:hypothetical protein D9758_005903 [Tetrapyrgos nigripes]